MASWPNIVREAFVHRGELNMLPNVARSISVMIVVAIIVARSISVLIVVAMIVVQSIPDPEAFSKCCLIRAFFTWPLVGVASLVIWCKGSVCHWFWFHALIQVSVLLWGWTIYYEGRWEHLFGFHCNLRLIELRSLCEISFLWSRKWINKNASFWIIYQKITKSLQSW